MGADLEEGRFGRDMECWGLAASKPEQRVQGAMLAGLKTAARKWKSIWSLRRLPWPMRAVCCGRTAGKTGVG